MGVWKKGKGLKIFPQTPQRLKSLPPRSTLKPLQHHPLPFCTTQPQPPMPNIHRPQQNHSFYHICNRGFGRQTLFFVDADFQRFFDMLERYQSEHSLLELDRFCLLPNHFHLLIFAKKASEISLFMQKLSTAYAMYFNLRYGARLNDGRKTPVFEGRYKSKLVDDAAYLQTVRNYIHQNAVNHRIVESPMEWGYSSFE